MVITQIIGGLGNQMFQYAIGRHLSLNNHDELLLDTSAYQRYKLHAYGLNQLNITERIAPPAMVEWPHRLSGRLRPVYRWIAPRSNIRIVKEKHFDFSPEVLSLTGDLYLSGYWQTEKYFSGIRETLLHEFLPRTIRSEAAQLKHDILSCPNAVAVHIRRGDYVSNAKTNKFHGTCRPEYYQKAAEQLRRQLGTLRFFIFSDDLDWVKQHIELGDQSVYVAGNKNYEDIHLMSCCRHNIIANSSFSWWGAWLNDSPNKCVVAPTRWFNTGSLDTKDIVPESWIRI